MISHERLNRRSASVSGESRQVTESGVTEPGLQADYCDLDVRIWHFSPSEVTSPNPVSVQLKSPYNMKVQQEKAPTTWRGPLAFPLFAMPPD